MKRENFFVCAQTFMLFVMISHTLGSNKSVSTNPLSWWWGKVTTPFLRGNNNFINNRPIFDANDVFTTTNIENTSFPFSESSFELNLSLPSHHQPNLTDDTILQILKKTLRFVIIGAQKCGTSSMYRYINQHPLSVRAKRRETHYLDSRFDTTLIANNNTNYWAMHRRKYLSQFDEEYLQTHYLTSSIFTGESSPSYLLHHDLSLPRMTHMIPWAKLIVILRNPVDRAYSQFQMIHDPNKTAAQLEARRRLSLSLSSSSSSVYGKPFLQAIEEEMTLLQQMNITVHTTHQEFTHLIVKQLPKLDAEHSYLVRGMYCFHLEAFLDSWPSEQIQIVSLKDIRGSDDKVVSFMNEHIFRFLNVSYVSSLHLEAHNKRDYQPMDPSLRDRLDSFFRPYNERLFRRLGRVLDW